MQIKLFDDIVKDSVKHEVTMTTTTTTTATATATAIATTNSVYIYVLNELPTTAHTTA